MPPKVWSSRYVLESAFHCLECDFVRHCSFISHYGHAPEAFLRFASLVVRDNAVRRFGIAAVAVHGSLYTFSVNPKWRTAVFWFFAERSSAEAYLRTSPSRGHSTAGVPKRCEGFVAIWLRAREEFSDNRFQLLFTYAVAIGPVTGRPFPWLLVRQLVTCKTQIASANQIQAFTSCCVASVDP